MYFPLKKLNFHRHVGLLEGILCGGFNILIFNFTCTWWDDPIWRAYFQMGWFNHQLVILHNLFGGYLYESLILVYYSNVLILHRLTALKGPFCRVILLLSMYYYIYIYIYIYTTLQPLPTSRARLLGIGGAIPKWCYIIVSDLFGKNVCKCSFFYPTYYQ